MKTRTEGKTTIQDKLARPLRDLRVSLTDRCNMRCSYCMPAEVFGRDYRFIESNRILQHSEIFRIVTLFASLGVRKIRLTGGEPLLRRGLPRLIESLRTIPGIEEIALTTNGWLLAPLAGQLHRAGLDRITVSLDSLEDSIFQSMNGGRLSVGPVLDGISSASGSGLPVKINMVVQRGVNEGQILPMAEYFRARGHTLRFIEYMDVGSHNHWTREQVVPFPEIRQLLESRYPLVRVPPSRPGETALRYRYLDTDAEVGFIASVTLPFCGNCNRARLSADGKLHTCLFSGNGSDLLNPMRIGESDDQLLNRIKRTWTQRIDRYSEQRAQLLTVSHNKPEMSYLGG